MSHPMLIAGYVVQVGEAFLGKANTVWGGDYAGVVFLSWNKVMREEAHLFQSYSRADEDARAYRGRVITVYRENCPVCQQTVLP